LLITEFHEECLVIQFLDNRPDLAAREAFVSPLTEERNNVQ
jgi:hypothetical protein